MAEQRLIEAEALYKKVLESHVTNIDGYSYINHNRVLKMIDNEPTVEAKPVVHAHWFLLDDCSNEGVYCSACTKKVYKTDYANQKLKSKYCPNCGAKMDESEDKK